MLRPPERGEAADYYWTYIDQVPSGDIRQILASQAGETLARLRAVSSERSLRRYAPGKWSIREVMSHINDAERVFAFRAFWFARGFTAAMPSYDQDAGVPAAAADARPWPSHLEEFTAVRAATCALFDSLPDQAWDRRGIASDQSVTVRALAYICAGHLLHHLGILEARYLQEG
jgi:hypothetical protein